MSTIVQPAPPPLPPPDEVYRFTVEQFDRMVRDGTIDEDDPVELLDGIVVRKMPKSPRHRVGVRKTVRALEGVIPPEWHVEKEEPIAIPPEGKPEPDVAVIRSELEFDATRDATAGDCCLVVEVAESKLAKARTEKLPIYARAGIPVYWIVNLSGGTPPGSGVVEVYSDPDQAGSYRTRADFHPGDAVPVVIEGREAGQIAVTDLLP